MQLVSFFLVFAFAFYSPTSFAKKTKQKTYRLSGVIERCHDGDTCRVQVNRKSIKIRFAGIDCPELSQKYGKEARNFTESTLKGKEVSLICDGKSFDRLTCTVFLGETNVNLLIVQNGWAYDSTKYSKGRYLASVNDAKIRRLGIWSDPNLVSPYCYRHKTNKKCATDLSYMP